MIGRAVEGVRAAGRPLGVCGEMASRVLGAAALLAVGVEELSVNPGGLPRIRRCLQVADAGPLRLLAPRLLASPDVHPVRELLREELSRQGVPEALLAGE